MRGARKDSRDLNAKAAKDYDFKALKKRDKRLDGLVVAGRKLRDKEFNSEGFKYGPMHNYDAMSNDELNKAHAHAQEYKKPGHAELIRDILRKRKQKEAKKNG